jgi:hypothetical protein
VIDQVLGLLNDPQLAGIWSEDEAIGWVYQYFTPKELRDQARKESQAPRNSYELAFRNQFFTPRYVVEFLTDNTLGRIWYDMRQGDTRLKGQCRYMVRRPTEVFLKGGEAEPKDAATATDDLSQEELLKLPVYVPFRVKKDPRELRILDPACGSGHFLLYCFDLLLTIYEEAYGDPHLGPALKKDYPTLADLQRDVPRLILAHNLHGIDIDPRASQIAALALWLRCQRAYQEMGIKQDRPKITRSNIVCAEPMPGEEAMLKEFVSQLEPKVLGQVVEVVFEKMKLAGEAGSLLKIEEEIRSAVATAKKQYIRETTHATDRKGHPLLFSEATMDRTYGAQEQVGLFDVSDLTDGQFFAEAETNVTEALRLYAETAHGTEQHQRCLFSEDAVRGFAFVDMCQKRYDILLMNPPFGLPCPDTYDMLVSDYPSCYADLAAAFLSLGTRLLTTGGQLGSITTRSYLQSSDLGDFRRDIVLPSLVLLLDLGAGVMDEAWVEASAQVLSNKPQDNRFQVVDRRQCSESIKRQPISTQNDESTLERIYFPSRSGFGNVPKHRLAYDATGSLSTLITSTERLKPDRILATTGLRTFDDERFYRLRWEVPPESIGPTGIWCDIAKNTDFGCWYMPYHTVVKWCGDGRELAAKNIEVNGQTAQARQGSKHYFKPGLCFSRRSEPTFSVRVHPSSAAFSSNGGVVIPKGDVSVYYLAGLLNSSAFRAAVKLLANKYSYTSGHVESLAWKEPDCESKATVTSESRNAVLAKLDIARMTETDPFFSSLPGLNYAENLADYARWKEHRLQELSGRILTAGTRIDGIVARLYSIDTTPEELASKYRSCVDDLAKSEAASETDCTSIAAAVVSYAMGCAFGRWDVRHSLGDGPSIEQPDPLGPLPTAPLGMLKGVDGLPLAIPPKGYPLEGEWDGIVVDDFGHPKDACSAVRQIFELIWRSRTDRLENEVTEALKVKHLRDYFRKPGKGGFWDDHVSRYSKSRRKAPIYWLLQSSKKNYAIWLYYHRLDKDILFKALVNYVEPKIRLEDDRLQSLRSQKGEGGKATKKLDKEIEKQEEFLSELRDFEEKLRRAAELRLEPDLNDGVVLNIAPLHELVPWKEAEKYWEELLEGKYEWSSIGKQLREKGLVK